MVYPERDPREAVVNAFHLRGHGDCNYDVIKIHIKPDCIDVISYPGPGPTLTKANNTESSKVPEVPSRNRKIARFLN